MKWRVYDQTGSDPEPGCEVGGEHEWREPHDLVGGLRENPGVWSRGGTLSFRSVCACCGVYRTETRHRDHREPEAVRYEPANEASEAWVASLRGE